MTVVREYIREEPRYVEKPRNSGSNLAWAIVLIVLLALLITYGIPAIRSGFNPSGTQINIPDHFNVNVNQGPQGGGPPAR